MPALRKSPIPIDYHLHTPLCHHAEGPTEAYVERALERGLTEIGFSDHNPMPDGFDPAHRMVEEQLPGYIEEIQRLQKLYEGRITIRLGLEADYYPGFEQYVREQLEVLPLDYVLGSVHFVARGVRAQAKQPVDEKDFVDRYTGRKIAEMFDQYFDLLETAARSRLFDVMSHPDLPKKFGVRPEEVFARRLEQLAKAFKEADVAYEINTSGLRRPVGEVFPTMDFIRIARKHGVPLTFGSDAHKPSEVSEDFETALELAREAGYAEFAVFEKRQRSLRPL